MTSNTSVETSALTFNPSSPFILVDGSSYLFRAFHAMPPLTNSNGHATGAIFGVVNMIGKLLEQYQPERIAVVFDAKGKNFRHEMYEEYKAHRPPMPDELRIQIEPIHQIIEAMGIPLLVIDGVEADDVMGTLAHQATHAKMDALLSTGDKDMAQLVNEHITLINTMNDTLMTPEAVEEKFHVKPEQIIDYLALMGDSSDNIPGIPKCGPKTAAKWLAEYDTIENLIENAEQIKGKIGENLRGNLDQLKLSQQLTTIRIDCDLPIALDDIKRQMPDMLKLQELFSEYDLRNWLSQVVKGEIPFRQKQWSQSPFPNRASQIDRHQRATTRRLVWVRRQRPPATESKAYDTIFDWDSFNAWMDKLQNADVFAIDTETTSLNSMEAEMVGISFAYAEKAAEKDAKNSENSPENHQAWCIYAAYLPLSHDYEGAPEQLNRAEVLAKMKPLLENPAAKKVGQNLKYDWHIFKNYDIELQGIAYDTMLESYCFNSVATPPQYGRFGVEVSESQYHPLRRHSGQRQKAKNLL